MPNSNSQKLKNNFLYDLNKLFNSTYENDNFVSGICSPFNKSLKKLIQFSLENPELRFSLLDFIKTSIGSKISNTEYLLTSFSYQQFKNTEEKYPINNVYENSFLFQLTKQQKNSNIFLNIEDILYFYKNNTLKSLQLSNFLNEKDKEILLNNINYNKHFFIEKEESLYYILIFINQIDLIPKLLENNISIVIDQKIINDKNEIINFCIDNASNDSYYSPEEIEKLKIILEQYSTKNKLELNKLPFSTLDKKLNKI